MSDHNEALNGANPAKTTADSLLTEYRSPSPAPILQNGNLNDDNQLKTESSAKVGTTEPQSVSDVEISQSPIIQTPVTQESVQSATPKEARAMEEEDNMDHMVEDLSPPPDSPMDDVLEDRTDCTVGDAAEDTMSATSSAPINALEDEIIVHTHHNKSSPKLEDGDVTMTNIDDSVVLDSRRKRTFTKYTEVDDVDDTMEAIEGQEPRTLARDRTKKHGSGNASNVIIGYWRDSTLPDPADKHIVIGFIDTRERLRTMSQFRTRDGRAIDKVKYPVPKGPGGSWVTFDKVVFDEHLVGLNQHVIKEFVRIRAANTMKNETPQQKAAKDSEAIELARQHVATNPPPASNVPPPVAYGKELPDVVAVPQHAAVQENKRRKVTTSSPAPVRPQPAKPIPGTRPTSIQIGYWKASGAANPVDKHAVYGVIGTNDTFRTKLGRETRDGRPIIDQVFPSGAGALWKIQFDECELDSHLRNLTRYELKEYCRVRQRQIDQGETPDQRVENETKAVYEAQDRVQQNTAAGFPHGPPIAQQEVLSVGDANDESVLPAEESDDNTPAPPRQNGLRGRKTLPDIEYSVANRGAPTPSTPNALEKRITKVANAEMDRVQRIQNRRSSRRDDGAQEAPDIAAIRKAELVKHVGKLNGVWESQEKSRIPAGDQDTKIYAGIKYERKQSGPLAGRLASAGTIINIDGEDYIEYRVLMKPSFC